MLTKVQSRRNLRRDQEILYRRRGGGAVYGARPPSPASPTTPSIRMWRKKTTVISVRTVFGGRTARATTNKLDDESLRRVVQASEVLAKVQQPDPDCCRCRSGEGARAEAVPSRYFAQTAALTPEHAGGGSEADCRRRRFGTNSPPPGSFPVRSQSREFSTPAD